MKTLCTIHAVAQREDGKILLLQRTDERDRPGKWHCVTGYIKEKEPAEEAVLRELQEETHLEGMLVKTADPYWFDLEGKLRMLIIASLVSVKGTDSLHIDERESRAFQWVALDDPMIQKIPSLKLCLKKLGMI